jgi:CBS domain-containing protein
MSIAGDRLAQISKQLQQGRDVSPITVRTFLSWFDAQRRGYWIVQSIRTSLEKLNLRTEPDFESAYIDSEIKFETGQAEQPSLHTVATLEVLPAVSGQGVVPTDPTYRISKLAAANNAPITVAPDASLESAVTLMMTNDFSQLPVTTSEREIKSIVSWNSIGSRVVLGQTGKNVRDVMDLHQEIRADASMFQAIPIIVQYGYVLVRGGDNRLTGIVTASDLSLQFQQLAEPFLLLGEIENHIRGMLDGKFEVADFAAIRDPSDNTRAIEGVSDLTFGEYVRLLENDARWAKVGIALDRKVFCQNLDQVRKIRNDVMHFDPDGVPPLDLERLREFARFLQRLQTIKSR